MHTSTSKKHKIILVHGLFMGRHAMLSLAKKLRAEKFEVQCFAYNTVTGTLSAGATKLARFVSKDAASVTLIGHSLGGLVSIAAAQHIAPSLLHSVVLLGSPYQGAQAAHVLRKVTGFSKAWVGRALHDWAALKEKPAVSVPVLTIAGSNPKGLGRFICRFKEANDGTLTSSSVLKNGGSFEYRGVFATYVATIQTYTLGFFFARTALRSRGTRGSQMLPSLQFGS